MSSLQNIILSGLQTADKRLQVAGSNIAASQVPGSMREVIYTKELTVEGQRAGVEVSQTYRDLPVEDPLLIDNRRLTQKESYYQTLLTGLQLLGNKLAQRDESNNLGALCQDFLNACGTLSMVPSSLENQADVLRQLNRITTYLKESSENNLQGRFKAEKETERLVKVVNSLLEDLSDINQEIISKNGKGTIHLETQRDNYLKELGKHIDFKVQNLDKRGGITILTKTGSILMDSKPGVLKFTPTPGLSLDSTYPATAAAITLEDDQGNIMDVTQAFSLGSIAAHIRMRDKEIPNIQAELDAFAVVFKNLINSTNNLGARIPPSALLKGTVEFNAGGATPFQGQGTWRAAIVGDDGSLVGYTDLDLAAYNTVGDLVTALNIGLSGIEATATASLQGADNHLEIAVGTPGRGIALTSVGPTATETTSLKNISHYFGLNDLVLSPDEGLPGVAHFLSVQSDSFTHATLSKDPLPQIGSIVLAKGDNSVTNTLITNLKKTLYNFGAAGNLGAQQQTLIGYAATIVSDLADRIDFAQKDADIAEGNLIRSDAYLADVAGISTMEEMEEMVDALKIYNFLTGAMKIEQKKFEALLSII